MLVLAILEEGKNQADRGGGNKGSPGGNRANPQCEANRRRGAGWSIEETRLHALVFEGSSFARTPGETGRCVALSCPLPSRLEGMPAALRVSPRI